MTKLVIILAAVGACIAPAAARADRWPVAQVETAMAVADNHWPWSACYGQHVITWTTDDAMPTRQTLAFGEVGGCNISVDWQRIWDIVTLCSVLEHEYGHNAGLEHSTDPHDIMYPDIITAPDCAAAFPAPPRTPRARKHHRHHKGH